MSRPAVKFDGEELRQTPQLCRYQKLEILLIYVRMRARRVRIEHKTESAPGAANNASFTSQSRRDSINRRPRFSYIIGAPKLGSRVHLFPTFDVSNSRAKDQRSLRSLRRVADAPPQAQNVHRRCRSGYCLCSRYPLFRGGRQSGQIADS